MKTKQSTECLIHSLYACSTQNSEITEQKNTLESPGKHQETTSASRVSLHCSPSLLLIYAVCCRASEHQGVWAVALCNDSLCTHAQTSVIHPSSCKKRVLKVWNIILFSSASHLNHMKPRCTVVWICYGILMLTVCSIFTTVSSVSHTNCKWQKICSKIREILCFAKVYIPLFSIVRL